ncbi:MAG: uroporphyrinogen-III synthase, partial [Xanthobacteraceae bacterium]
MKVLVTRPEPAASLLAEAIREQGHEALVCSLTREVVIDFDPRSIGDADAWIITSARAAAALCELPERPVFAAGTASERAARDAGARTIVAGRGGWYELSEMILQSGLPSGARLVHLAGREVTGNLAGELRRAGYFYDRVVVYAMDRIAEADGLVEMALRRGAVDSVALMSPRAARLFCEIVAKRGLGELASRLCVFALSPAIAD